jgi:Xaa-Pro aminopeptidase
VARIVKEARIKRLGFEAMNLPYAVAMRLKKILKKADAVPVAGVVEKARSVKDAGEACLIKKAAALTGDVMRKVASSVRAGVTERSLASSAEREFVKRGAHPAFESIVAFSANSSKPHARPGEDRISKNGFVMIDIGGRLNGYCADITRMVFTGAVPSEIRKIYSVVSSAQKMAIERIRPGARISDIDCAARGYIKDKGYGKNFGHSLGHGVGLEVHEDPSISPLGEGRLEKGMVFTVEPAIYLPKVGGVRIEDMVLVTDNGCEVLTR